MAKVVSINLSEETGVKKDPASRAVAVVDKGLEGDAVAGFTYSGHPVGCALAVTAMEDSNTQ